MKARIPKPSWLLLLTCFITVRIQADKTFVWTGDDSRFNGSFSISEADFDNRTFQRITQARYEFRDPANPAVNVVLDDPAGFYPGGMGGSLTLDGQHLSHTISNDFISFWVAVWKPGSGIEVGMYGFNQGDVVEHFDYWNRGFIAHSTGVWSLQVPEPSATSLMLTGASLALAYGVTKRKQQR